MLSPSRLRNLKSLALIVLKICSWILQELINTVEVLLCMRHIILEVFESWKSVQRDVRRKQQQQQDMFDRMPILL